MIFVLNYLNIVFEKKAADFAFAVDMEIVVVKRIDGMVDDLKFKI